LVWYADLLGRVRDQDILSSRLAKQLAELPAQQRRGPVEAEITKTLAEEREKAVAGLTRGMRGKRYEHLVQLVRGSRAALPLTDAAGEKDKTAAEYAEKAKQKADKRLRKADDDIEKLHRARRATKRARYAAELVTPADSDMKAVAREAEELQALLGEHQDAVVSASFLAKISAAGNGETAENGFTYGVLMANELHRAAEIRRSLRC
jgi:CHAD domain-containing protein